MSTGWYPYDRHMPGDGDNVPETDYVGNWLDMNDRVEQALTDSLDWFPNVTHTTSSFDLLFWSTCLNGEQGELANKIKKYARGSMTVEELIPLATDELVDVFVYAYNVAGALGIDLEAEYDRKREYNQERFGGGKATNAGAGSPGSGS